MTMLSEAQWAALRSARARARGSVGGRPRVKERSPRPAPALSRWRQRR